MKSVSNFDLGLIIHDCRETISHRGWRRPPARHRFPLLTSAPSHSPASRCRHRGCACLWRRLRPRRLAASARMMRVRIGGHLRGGGLAGADRPDRLIGNGHFRGLVRRKCREMRLAHWRRRTSSVRPASRSSRTSPTQTIGISPASSATLSLRLTVSSVSPKYWRRSEWPMMTCVQPAARSMPAEISPV